MAEFQCVWECVCVFVPSAYLSGCQGDKVIDSEWDDLPKKADYDPSHLVTRHRDVKKHLRERERETLSINQTGREQRLLQLVDIFPFFYALTFKKKTLNL